MDREWLWGCRSYDKETQQVGFLEARNCEYLASQTPCHWEKWKHKDLTSGHFHVVGRWTLMLARSSSKLTHGSSFTPAVRWEGNWGWHNGCGAASVAWSRTKKIKFLGRLCGFIWSASCKANTDLKCWGCGRRVLSQGCQNTTLSAIGELLVVTQGSKSITVGVFSQQCGVFPLKLEQSPWSVTLAPTMDQITSFFAHVHPKLHPGLMMCRYIWLLLIDTFAWVWVIKFYGKLASMYIWIFESTFISSLTLWS